MRVGERSIEGQIRERDAGAARSTSRRRTRGSGRASSSRSGRTSSRPASRTSARARSCAVEIEFSGDAGASTRARSGCASRWSSGRATSPARRSPAAYAGSGWSADTDRGAGRIARSRRRCCRPGDAPRNPVRSRSISTPGFPVEKLAEPLPRGASPRRGARAATTCGCATRSRRPTATSSWPGRRSPGRLPRSALFTEEHGGATYALLTLFPPVGPAVDAAASRARSSS